MQFKSKAKNPRDCAFGPCLNSGNKIYIGNKYKYLACSLAHAELAEQELYKIPEKERKKIWKKS